MERDEKGCGVGDLGIRGSVLTDSVRDAIEYCFEQDYSDGLPVVPATEESVREFLSRTPEDPDRVIGALPHLGRSFTVRIAAVNAIMAGCRADYFPAVLAAWESIKLDGYVFRGLFQSTTGTFPFLVLNGPVREKIGLNCGVNIFGPGNRASATIGRAIRLIILNGLGIRPGELDQSTQASPAKYTFCIGENEEQSPWVPLHVERGWDISASTVAAMMARSCVHIENRHAGKASELLYDISDTVARTGALLHDTTSVCLVLGPEHARLLHSEGLNKDDVKEEIFRLSRRRYVDLERAGKAEVSKTIGWRVPSYSPDVRLEGRTADKVDSEGRVPVLASPDSVVVIVAGGANAGVSAIVETIGAFGMPEGSVRIPPIVARGESDGKLPALCKIYGV